MDVVKVVAEFAVVTTLSILADRYVSDRAAMGVLFGSLLLLCWFHKREIEEVATWAQSNKLPAIVGCVVIFAIIGLGLGILITRPSKEAKKVTIPALPTKPIAAEVETKPVIQISWEMGGLPINIAPRGSAYILTLLENLTADWQNIENDKDSAWLWPSNKPFKVPEPILIFRMSNHDSARVFNIRALVNITFQFPPSEGRGVATSLTREIRIDSLAPGQSFPIYLVNESKYWIDIPLPTVAILQVEGDIGKHIVRIVPHGMLADFSIPTKPSMDNFVMPLASSNHIWRNGKMVAVRPNDQPRKPRD